MNQAPKNNQQNMLDRDVIRAFWISIGTGIVMLGIVVYFLITDSGTDLGGFTDVRIIVAGISLSGFISAWIVRKTNKVSGMALVLLTWYIASVLTVLGIKNIGLVISMVILAVTFGLTSTILSGTRVARYLNILVVLVSAFAILLDIIQPFPRAENTTPVASWGMAFILVVGYGVLIAFNFNKYGLRTKLLITLLAATVIPVALISIITYFSSRTALIDAGNAKLLAAAGKTAATFDDFINFNLDTVRTSAKFEDVVGFLLLPADQRVGSAEEDHAKKILTTISRQDPVFISSVAIFDINGVDIADTFPSDVGLDKSDRAYFKNTISTGLPYVSDVEFASTTGAPSIYFVAPVRDATGKILGIIRIRYFATILQQIITQNTGLTGATSYAVLIDPNHIRLAHGTDRDRLFKSIIPLNPAKLQELQTQKLMPPGTVEQLSTNLYDFEAGFNKVDRTPFFASDTNGDGSLEQSAIAKLTTKPWQVAFIQSQSVLFAPATAQTTINLLAALAVASLIGIAGYFFSQTLSGPIVRLTQIAEAISGGDINLQATVETKDEVGTLAEAFNRMTHQLRDFIANLEERVAARTKDLATVAEVGTATATILETQKLLQAVVDLTKERFNLYHSHIYLLDDDGKNLVLAAGAGEPGRIMVEQKRFIPLDREQSLVARAARERNGVTVNDVREAPDFLPNPLLPNTRSELAVPMIVGGMVIGVFDIQSDQIGRFTESDINIQTTLAAQISTSIQNVRSFEESRAQAELESLVNSISQKIQRATTVEDTLQTAVREIGVALGAIRVSANLQAGFADRNNGASQN